MSSFRDERNARQRKGRLVNTREELIRILIVCEGQKTEPNYFLSFDLRADVSVEVEGQAGNTISLIRKADEVVRKKEYRVGQKLPGSGQGEEASQYNNSSETTGPNDEVWCVFDRDSFPNGNFNTAIQMAEARGYKCAYTNEAFELWYLLHYDFHISSTSRESYARILTEKLGREYKKNDKDVYTDLLERQHTAIKNAQKLLKEYGDGHNPEENNPCTTVHLLVMTLNKYLRK